MEALQQDDQQLFENTIKSMEAELANVGVHLTIDSSARQLYTKKIRAMSNELRVLAASGKITWLEAAQQASTARNVIMDIIRTKSTPVGLSIAQSLKQQGKTLNELVASKAQKMYGKSVNFDKLTDFQKDKVYSEVVKSAGKSRPEVTAAMKKLSYAGRSLVFVSIALSVYTVATAENKFDAAGREIAITGAGVGGGFAGGALAGLACGPGAPICVTVGAFIGGALSAFGVGMLW
ncbi:hypothetical protein [Oceanobacter mangrovi]|uniref:hypothetical protein n=1 Tax=Oceanobacter mangrovi TaxID=2862510 RepID=UPI001C8D5432|nr:hypothetical protein [Oceanobacter mangrovi]